MGSNYGDRLAGGAHKAAFPSTTTRMTQEAWDKLWEKEDDPNSDSVRTDATTPGNVSSNTGETKSNS